MNVQTTSSEILGEVYWHVGTEVLETLALREADDSDIIKLGNAVKAARGARANLLPLLNVRADNMQTARKLYIELQRQALAAADIREPRAVYAPLKLRLAS